MFTCLLEGVLKVLSAPNFVKMEYSYSAMIGKVWNNLAQRNPRYEFFNIEKKATVYIYIRIYIHTYVTTFFVTSKSQLLAVWETWILACWKELSPNCVVGYKNLTSEVIWGHQRSKTVNWGHWGQNFKTTPRDAVFCTHTHMTPRNNVRYVNLISEVKGGQNSEIIGGIFFL